MDKSYQKIRKNLRAQTRKSRDREVRVKVELILLGLKLDNVSEACARRGFSRKFYYKWWKRLKKARYDIKALEEFSRRPKRKHPRQISRRLEQRIFYFNGRGYGARMMKEMLEREGKKVSKSVICHVLNHRRKQKKRRSQKLKAHRRRYELHIPGQRLQLDVKYVPEFVSGMRVYNFVAVDECTRWRFARGYFDLSWKSTVDFLKRLKQECPFPINKIQTDNGFEFTYKLVPKNNSEHPMDSWCRKNRIAHQLIPPGEKELNGKVERSHRIDEQYFYWRAPTNDIYEFNYELSRWINNYNTIRPHGGLDYITPYEKLLERLETLQTEPVEEKLQPLRLSFLAEAPSRQTKEQRLELMLNEKLEEEFNQLEIELIKYNNAA